jgi:hypothetical protein
LVREKASSAILVQLWPMQWRVQEFLIEAKEGIFLPKKRKSLELDPSHCGVQFPARLGPTPGHAERKDE